jgi:hypothetical protein
MGQCANGFCAKNRITNNKKRKEKKGRKNKESVFVDDDRET